MTGRLLLAASVVFTIAPALHAQDGLRSASLPERPVATQPPGPADLFRAGPDTYRPRPHPRPEPVRAWPFFPYVDLPQPVRTRPRTEPVPVDNDPRERTGADSRSGTAHESGADLYGPSVIAPSRPPVNKTLYVIPRCYAGDKPPDPGTTCDLTQLRTIR